MMMKTWPVSILIVMDVLLEGPTKDKDGVETVFQSLL